MLHYRPRAAAILACLTFATACSSPPSSPEGSSTTPASTHAEQSGENEPSQAPPSSAEELAGTTVRLITYDSFAAPEGVFEAFAQATGISVEVIPSGGAGMMVNQLILTKEAPLGDAVFGIDNTLASRALEEGILAARPSDSAGEAAGASDSAGGAESEGLAAPSEPSPLTHALPPEQVALSAPFGDDADKLTAITTSDVCVLADHRWFAAHDLPEPTTFSDLAKPEYASLLVVENPATSSPGLSFLLATISALGDGWPEYWRTMADGGVKVVDSWSSAYYVDFSGPSSEGDRPLVVSYASSPPAEVPEGGSESPVGALLDTCFRQVEYAGVLAGGASEAAAWVVVDFLASRAFQDTVAENMWVFPADPGAGIPPSWTEHAPRPSAPWELDPRQIATHRDDWIRQWTDIVAS